MKATKAASLPSPVPAYSPFTGDWWFDMQDLVAVVTFDEPNNPSGGSRRP
jgi:hypothetical protein